MRTAGSRNNHLSSLLLLLIIAVSFALCSKAAVNGYLKDNIKGESPVQRRRRHPSHNDGDVTCDLFQGKWVVDDTGNHPVYNGSVSCPFVTVEFDCQKNGRPDQTYLKYRWQPRGCDLPRFDGQDFLTRFKGKKIMFVGDSLSVNQYQSLKCMLYSSVQRHQSHQLKYTLQETEIYSILTLEDYNMTIELNHSPFLVDVVNEDQGRVLNLESVKLNSKTWVGKDVLVFNSWHWWPHRGKIQGWDYIQWGGKLYKDMDRMEAYKVALNTWANWVDSNINPQTTRVFFQGISPTHSNGNDWGQPNSNCLGQTEPFLGSEYPVGPPLALDVVKGVLRNMSSDVILLDITLLSQFRKDGHPSHYGLDGVKGNDCSHWCLAGVPDTWNEILYALLIPSAAPSHDSHRRRHHHQ